MKRQSKAVQWIAESLNEYADLISRGESVANHMPSSPEFWFDGLARETANGWRVPCAAILLSKESKRRMQKVFKIEVA